MKLIRLNKLQSRILLLFVIFIFPVAACKAQFNFEHDSLSAQLKVEYDTVNYGIIPRNSNPYRYINFKNVGKEPLLVSAFGDLALPVACPKTPVNPGENARIKISYPTDRTGPFMCFIGINSNAFPHQKIIYVKGWVLSATDASKTK